MSENFFKKTTTGFKTGELSIIMAGDKVGKSMIELVEAERNEEGTQYIYSTDDKLKSLVPPGKTGYIMCQCEWGGTCPNNPAKQLIGSFALCHIKIK